MTTQGTLFTGSRYPFPEGSDPWTEYFLCEQTYLTVTFHWPQLLELLHPSLKRFLLHRFQVLHETIDLRLYQLSGMISESLDLPMKRFSLTQTKKKRWRTRVKIRGLTSCCLPMGLPLIFVAIEGVSKCGDKTGNRVLYKSYRGIPGLHFGQVICIDITRVRFSVFRRVNRTTIPYRLFTPLT